MPIEKEKLDGAIHSGNQKEMIFKGATFETEGCENNLFFS